MTGFAAVSTDAVRKRDGTETATQSYGTGDYTRAAREAVYETLCDEVDRRLAAGYPVIADATFLRAADRARLATVAHAHRRPIVFVECTADEHTVRARLTAREDGASLSSKRRWGSTGFWVRISERA